MIYVQIGAQICKRHVYAFIRHVSTLVFVMRRSTVPSYLLRLLGDASDANGKLEMLHRYWIGLCLYEEVVMEFDGDCTQCLLNHLLVGALLDSEYSSQVPQKYGSIGNA